MIKPDRRINETEALQIIKSSHLGYISMIDVENKPYGVCVNYVYHKEDHCLYFHCSRIGRKIEALKKDPRISMLVVKDAQIMPEIFITHYQSAMIEGTITFIETIEEKRKALHLICDGLCPGILERRDEVIEKFLSALLIGCIHIDTVTGKKNEDD